MTCLGSGYGKRHLRQQQRCELGHPSTAGLDRRGLLFKDLGTVEDQRLLISDRVT